LTEASGASSVWRTTKRIDGSLTPTTFVLGILTFHPNVNITAGLINPDYLSFKPHLYIPCPICTLPPVSAVRAHCCLLYEVDQLSSVHCMPNSMTTSTAEIKKKISKCSNRGGAHSAGYNKTMSYLFPDPGRD